MTVSDYISGFPKDVQKILRAIRKTIRAAVPAAEESISYKIPTYKLNGHPVIYFAAFKSHVGLYPVTPPVKAKFKKELAGYKGGKGTVKFPLDAPIPYALITKIAKFKLAQAKATKKAASSD